MVRFLTFISHFNISIPTTLFAFTLLFGCVGWAQVYLADLGYVPFGSVFYHTLLALTGDSSYLFDTKPTVHTAAAVGNIWLEITRFTGLLTTVSAVLAVVTHYFAGRIIWRLAARRKGHTVLVGATDFSASWCDEKRPLNCIDMQPALDTLSSCALPPKTLRLVHQPERLSASSPAFGKDPQTVVFGGKDGLVNINAARAWVKDRNSVTPKTIPKMVIRVEQKTVARDIDLLAPTLIHAKLISRSDTIARSFVTHTAPSQMAHLRAQARVHIVLVGLGDINLAIAEEIVLRCHRSGQQPPHITVLDKDKTRAHARMRRERPDMLNSELKENGVELNFRSFDALECCNRDNIDVLGSIEEQTPVTAVVIAAGDETISAGIAMRLRRVQVEHAILRAPIFMQSPSYDAIAPAMLSDLTGGIVPFGGRLLTRDDAALEHMHESLAETLHNLWRNSSDVKKTPANTWDNLSASKRRSSYRAALSSNEILFGAGLVPPPNAGHADLRAHDTAINTALGDAALIERLTVIEHLRWNAERRLEGFKCAPPGHSDPAKKKHDLLVPQSELPEGQDKKDRVNVQEALLGALERGSEAKDNAPRWRKVLRVGVLGPLDTTDAYAVEVAKNAIAALTERHPEFHSFALEILTPNAPGFDRKVPAQLAKLWHEATGRPARLLAFEAADKATLDVLAMLAKPEIASEQPSGETAVLRGLKAAGALASVTLDMRPLGVSNAEILKDNDARDAALQQAQDAVLRLSDELIIDTNEGAARWTMAARDAWSKAAPIELMT